MTNIEDKLEVELHVKLLEITALIHSLRLNSLESAGQVAYELNECVERHNNRLKLASHNDRLLELFRSYLRCLSDREMQLTVGWTVKDLESGNALTHLNREEFLADLSGDVCHYYAQLVGGDYYPLESKHPRTDKYGQQHERASVVISAGDSVTGKDILFEFELIPWPCLDGSVPLSPPLLLTKST